MATDERGRWFRVYARQVDEHSKFRDLTALELGAWTALRAECELRDRALLRDRADALLTLRRRRVPRPAVILDRLIDVHLFDVDAAGRITVHDRADHDRPKYPSDDPENARERQRRARESRASHESVTSRDRTRDDSGHDTHARVQPQPQPQQAEPSPSIQPQPQQAEPSPSGLPGEADSATAACRMFLNGGRWLSDPEYVAAWDDLDHRYSVEWVEPEIQPAYTTLHAANPRVKPWELVKAVDLRCAERLRGEERRRDEAAARREDTARAEREAATATMTADERERQSLIRRAIGVWIKGGRKGTVPEKADELRQWLAENGAQA